MYSFAWMARSYQWSCSSMYLALPRRCERKQGGTLEAAVRAHVRTRRWRRRRENGLLLYPHYLQQRVHHIEEIIPLIVQRYTALLMGERPSGLTSLNAYIDVLHAIHLVLFASDAGRPTPPCADNPAGLLCMCKGFRHVGICSHVLVVNLWQDDIDLGCLLGDIACGRSSKGGFSKRCETGTYQRDMRYKAARLK